MREGWKEERREGEGRKEGVDGADGSQRCGLEKKSTDLNGGTPPHTHLMRSGSALLCDCFKRQALQPVFCFKQSEVGVLYACVCVSVCLHTCCVCYTGPRTSLNASDHGTEEAPHKITHKLLSCQSREPSKPSSDGSGGRRGSRAGGG